MKHNIKDLLFKIKELEEFKASAPTPIVNTDGSVFFPMHGKRHTSGLISYFNNGKLHREDGPAKQYDNSEEWYLNGEHHRVGGPAIYFYDNGDQEWWVHDKRHREDGPALIYGKDITWWINDQCIDVKSQKEFEKLMKFKAFW